MILVLPFCSKDSALAIANVRWMAELDGKQGITALLSYDDKTPKQAVAEMKEAANAAFTEVLEFWYPAPQKTYWPAGPNWAWQQVARYMAIVLKKPWLFLEADAVPIRPGWLRDIAQEYSSAKKPFMGHIVDGMGHMNGVCVYPPDVAWYSQGAMRTEEMAWDVVMGHEFSLREGGILSVVHPAHTLFQHCWVVNPETGRAWNGSGEPATFRGFNDLLRLVDLTMAIFHRCKDGTLIEWLRKYHQDPRQAMVPQHTGNTRNEEQPENRVQDVPRNDPLVAGSDPRGPDQAEQSGSASEDPKPTAEVVEPVPPTEIFIVTYGRPTKRASGLVVSDFDWLAWCLRGIRRHASGFAGITLAIPDQDAGLLKPLAKEHSAAKKGLPLRVKMFREPPGKGFIAHEVVMASADEFVPTSTKLVLHVDSDVIFKEPVTPSDYFCGEKPIYLWRTYESLIGERDGQRVVSDCYQWKGPTEAQLGFPVNEYTMVRHPSGFPIDFYKLYRDHISSVHGKPFADFMYAGRNEFPSNRMDFTAMGAFAFHRMHDRFSWVDISGGNHLAPRDKQNCYWSHGGVTEHIRKEIESTLK